MTKPTLYLELDGPVIIPDEHGDPILNGKLAPYAKPFLHWASHNFHVQLLTENDVARAIQAFRLAGLPHDAMPIRGYDGAKTDFMDPTKHFYWVDSILTPNEVAWLTQHNLHHRCITVDPEVGLEESHKKHLESTLHEHR